MNFVYILTPIPLGSYWFKMAVIHDDLIIMNLLMVKGLIVWSCSGNAAVILLIHINLVYTDG
ncbi:MAG: hypothetical protein JWP81_3954 [Ferruginibacter sp.]|nr:hypothetical protein [Ferruginibacter sp.]